MWSSNVVSGDLAWTSNASSDSDKLGEVASDPTPTFSLSSQQIKNELPI